MFYLQFAQLQFVLNKEKKQDFNSNFYYKHKKAGAVKPVFFSPLFFMSQSQLVHLCLPFTSQPPIALPCCHLQCLQLTAFFPKLVGWTHNKTTLIYAYHTLEEKAELGKH